MVKRSFATAFAWLCIVSVLMVTVWALLEAVAGGHR